MIKPIRIRSALLAVVVAALVPQIACAQSPKKIAVGDVSTIAPNWPSFVAKEKGFYLKEGVDPEVTYVGNVAGTVQQLAGGAFDIAQSTFDTAIRAIEGGADAVIIGGLVTRYPYSIMTPATIRSVQDLKGKQIILPFPKDLLTIVWNRWVREQGMDPKSIDQIYDGATPNRFNALATGTVQAALVSQPFDFRAEAQGYKKLLDIGRYAQDYGFLVVLGRPQWLKSNPDAARAYLRALSAGVDWLYDPANRDEAIAILAKYTKLEQAFAVQTYDYYIRELQPFSRGLAVPSQIIASTLKTLVEIGDVKQSETTGKKLTDFSYLPR